MRKSILLAQWLFLISFLLYFPYLILPVSSANGIEQIRVVTDDHYPPFTFLDNGGTIQGIAVDQWRLFEKKTGIAVNITGLPWNEAQEQVLAGNYDVIETLGYTRERAAIYDFSSPYADIDSVIFFSRNIPGISGPESLSGYVVAVQAGDSAIETLRSHGVTSIKEYPGYEEIIRDAKEGIVHVFCMDKPAALFFMHKYDIASEFQQTSPLYSFVVHRGVKKGNPILSTVQDGFNRISKTEYDEINRKWYGTPVIGSEYLVYILIFSGGVLVIVSALILWNLMLNRRVKKKTADLVREIEISNSRAIALAESEQFLNSIVENIPDMIITRDVKELRFIRINRAGEELLGYSREDLTGKNDYDIFPKEEAAICTAKDREVIRGRHLVDIPEEWIQTRDQGRRVLHTKKIPVLDKEGNPQYLLGISEDITERKHAENILIATKTLLQTIYDGSPDMIYIYNSDGRIVDVNENAIKKTGFSREELAITNAEDTYGDGYTSEMALKMMNQALETGSSDFEWVLKRKNGEEFPVEVSLRRLESVTEEGTTGIHILAIVRDITERKQAEESIKRATKKLNMLNTITFNDIQSAVFCLSGYLDLEKAERKEEEERQYLDKQVNIVQIISDSLTFAHNYQNLGLYPSRWQNVEETFLFGISHLDLSSFSRRIETDNLEIFADPLLETVFFSLAKNTLVHGETASEIALWYHEDLSRITIYFEDNGKGISPGLKRIIFERKSPEKEGMGLFLTREILGITGITIIETGEFGKGARFEIVVPKWAYRIIRKSEG